MLLILAPLLFSLFSLVQSSQFPFPHHPASPTPTPPKLQWLFTVHLMTLQNPAPLLPGPQGIRIDLAIIGGTFQGLGGLNGTMRGDTADWAVIDPSTGIGSADARWTIVLPPTNSTQGADSFIYVKSMGPSQKRGGLNRAHLRLKLETGVPEYYWINNVCAVGVLDILNPNNSTMQDVRIQAFNFVDDWAPTDKVFTVESRFVFLTLSHDMPFATPNADALSLDDPRQCLYENDEDCDHLD